MNQKGKKKPSDSRSRPQKVSRPADSLNLLGDGPDFHRTKVGLVLHPNRYSVPAVCAFLLLAVVLVFGQTLRHDLLQYDDDDYVVNNPQVAQGFSARGVVWAFTHFHSNNWHPLTWLSHMLDCQLHGLNHPGGHHLTNLLLHAANAILLFLLLRQMTSNLWPSALVATLFAIHPLHVESVAWVAERKDLLSGLFFMLTLLAYTGYARRPFSLLRYLLVTALFTMGLMAKPMLLTLPFVLLLLDYWPLSRYEGAGKRARGSGSADKVWPMMSPWWLILEKLPWLLLTAASCAMTYLAQGTAVIAAQRLLLKTRIANALVSYVTYLVKFFCPAGLAVFYPHWQTHSRFALPIWNILGSLLLLIGISLAVLACRRKCPYLPVGWFWYLGMLVPVIGLVQVGGQAMADRYTYLTQIGLYVMFAWGAADVASIWPYYRWFFKVVLTLVVAGFMSCAWQQTQYWSDDEALWAHTLACTQKNWLAHNNLGTAMATSGRLDEAIAQYEKAIEINPDFAEAHNKLGRALANRGQVEKAIAHYQKALKINPDFAEAHWNFGSILIRFGRVDEAIAEYQKALEINPDFAEAHNNLGTAMAVSGRLDEAVAQYEKALEINPDFAEAHNNLGRALANRGQVDRAITHYQKALEINPDFAIVLNNLAWILATHPDPKFRDGPQAVTLARRAVELSSGSVETLNTLAAAAAEAGRFADAVKTARDSLNLATQLNQPALVETIQSRIRLYEAETPFHELKQSSPAKTSIRP